ncbi:MAG TPA: L-glutamate gamma-semialdehyde dehydrogenase [Thermodesulfovibrionales bacterium]|nr:L-glutamate gamma-semialdehyde dehydrogenase [Thermodesulfovibrionales bacterium]
MTDLSLLEERIGKIGLRIYAEVKGETPSIFERKRWLGRIMELAMKDESFKIALFKFIDVLPSLKTGELVVRLLAEYFSEEAGVPIIIRRGLERISSKRVLPFVVGRVMKTAVETLARQFIAGRDLEDASRSLDLLRDEEVVPSIALLGEVVVSEREARDYAERYLGLLDFLSLKGGRDWVSRSGGLNEHPRSDISLKISSFYSQLDPMDWQGSIEGVKARLRPVFEKAEETGTAVTFDMEHYYYKDVTIAIFRSIVEQFREFSDAGIAIQAYLRDAREDLINIIEWAKEKKRRITIRLVKGAYWDHEVVVNGQRGWPLPVFLDKEETELNFEELTRLVLENSQFVRPAIASHNIRSISHAIAFAESLGLPKESFEFQMLYGTAESVRKVLRRMDYRVKVYAPVGELIPGMAYLVRRLLENTSDESFLRRSFFERESFEEMMKPPLPKESVKEGIRPGFRNEPTLDFSRAINREMMREALSNIKGEFNRHYPLLLRDREVRTEREMPSLNPARPDEVVGIVSSASRKEAEEAIEEARNASETWRKVSPEERARILFRAAEEMRKRRFELSALEVYEAGKTWKDADGDITEAIDYLEYYGREMTKSWAPRPLGDYPGEENEYLYEPRGIGVVISPWNFPLAIAAGMVSAAVVSGNCVIFKPSGLTPVTAWRLVEVFKNAGLPGGVLQYLPGPGEEVGEYLVSHPAIDFIAFTGSKDVGLRIITLAGETHAGQRNVKRVIAEMGGKNAIIVDETADLDEAVKGVLESALVYQGQKCSACSRAVVVGDVFDEFCLRLREAMESIKIGPPEEPGIYMGPVIDKGALGKVERYIEIAKDEGRALLVRRSEGQGYFIGPAVFTEVKPHSRIAQEEIFGPLLAVMRAGDIDEAIGVANSTSYALTGGIFSRSPRNIRKAKAEFRVGNLYINRKITGALVGRQPFGGFGMSGVGAKAGGPDYLLQFMNPKSISENTLRRGFAQIKGNRQTDTARL